MKKIPLSPLKKLLRKGGYKVTPGRVAILEVLESSGKPLSVAQLMAKLPKKLNPTTVYRALEALAKSGFIRKVHLRHAHTHYELVVGVKHHHHIICERCGIVEDIENCNTQNLEQAALKKSQAFASIRSHSLEFFGICKKCVSIAQ